MLRVAESTFLDCTSELIRKDILAFVIDFWRYRSEYALESLISWSRVPSFVLLLGSITT